MSVLVLGEILGVFVNTFTADGKYPSQDCENLQLPIQVQLFEKHKTFSPFFFVFWSLDQILNILKENILVLGNVFCEIRDCEELSWSTLLKARFQNTL